MKPGVCGPTATPASRYPAKGDSRSRLAIAPKMKANTNPATMVAMSGVWCGMLPRADSRRLPPVSFLYATKSGRCKSGIARGRDTQPCPCAKRESPATVRGFRDQRAEGSGPRLGFRFEAAGRAALAGIVARRRATGRHRRARPRRRGFAAADPDGIAAQERPHLFARQRLVLEEGVGDRVQIVEVLGQDPTGRGLALVDQAADLVIDQLGRRVGDVLALRHRVAEENF